MKHLYHVVYRRGDAGLSNLIMSVELGVVLAHLTGRVLVLAENNTPVANVVAYDGLLPETKSSVITDLLDLPIPWIDGEDFDLGGREALELTDKPPWESLFCHPLSVPQDSPDFEAFRRGRQQILTYGPELQDIPVLKYGSGTGEDTFGFYSYFFYLDQPTRRSVHDLLKRMKPKPALAALAARIAEDLAPFNAAHIRRGDFKVTLGVTTLDRSAQHVVDALKPHFDPAERLVILTDEMSDPIFEDVAKAYPDHVFLDHYILENYRTEFLELPCRDSIALAYLCQLVAAYSEDFVGSMTSTFTSLIQRYRGNRGKRESFKFLWNEIPDEGADIKRGRHRFSECVPLENGMMVEERSGPYSWNRINPRLNPAWMREWPESFLGQEVGPAPGATSSASSELGSGIGASTCPNGGRPASVQYISFDGQEVSFSCDDPELSSAVAKVFGPMLADACVDRVGEIGVKTAYGQRQLYINDELVQSALFTANPLRSLGREIACRFIDARPDLIWLHAGAVARGEQCVVLPGPWGSGKSTLVCELCDLGWSYFSDDIVPIDPRSGLVLPFPQTPQMRDLPNGELGREQLSSLPKRAVKLASDQIGREPSQLARIVLPRFDRHVEPGLAPYSPALAVGELLESCLSAARDQDSAIPALCELVERAPAYRLIYVDAKAAAERIEMAMAGDTSNGQSDGEAVADGSGDIGGIAQPQVEEIRVLDAGDEAILNPSAHNGAEAGQMNGAKSGSSVREVDVRIDLAGGGMHKTVLPSDSPILHDLFAALATSGKLAAERESVLFQVPLNGGSSACSFSSAQLLSVITEPPVLIETRHQTGNGALPGQYDVATPTHVLIHDFLTPAENEKILKYAIRNRDNFESSTVTPVQDDFRSSHVLYRIFESKWRDVVISRLKVHVPHILRSLNLAEFPVGNIELQLTASNEGDFFKTHADDGDDADASREITFVYYAHKEPKRFGGGELLLYGKGGQNGSAGAGPSAIIEPTNNMLVAFTSWTDHEVAIVRCPSSKFSHSRFTVNGWIRSSEGQAE